MCNAFVYNCNVLQTTIPVERAKKHPGIDCPVIDQTRRRVWSMLLYFPLHTFKLVDSVTAEI